MQFHRSSDLVAPSLESQSFSKALSLSVIHERATQSIQLCEALNSLPHLKSSERSVLAEQALRIINSNSWAETNPSLPAGRLQEIVQQKLSRQFFITERFTSLATGNCPHIQPQTQPLEERIEKLNPDQLALIGHVGEFCPFSAGMMTVFLAEELIPVEKNHHRNLSAVSIAQRQKETLALAGEAIDSVDTFIGDLLSNIPKTFGSSSQAIVNAWRQDLILPIIESSIYTVAAGITPLEFGHAAGGSWYSARIAMPNDPASARRFYNEWRDLHETNQIIRRLMLYEGVDISDAKGRHQTIKDRLLPIPLLVGTNDPNNLLTWYRDSFQVLSRFLRDSSVFQPRMYRGGGLIEFENGSQILFRNRSDTHGQSRIGLTMPINRGHISIRLDLDEHGLSVDFGSVDPTLILEHAKGLVKANRKPIDHYNGLRQELSSKLDRSTMSPSDLDGSYARVNMAAERISHFSADTDKSMREIPYFIAAMGGVGRSLGLRSENSIGHHCREATYKLSVASPRIETEFQECVGALVAANLYRQKTTSNANH